MRAHKDELLGSNITADFPGIQVELDSNRANMPVRSMGRSMSFSNVSVLVTVNGHLNLTVGSRYRSMLPAHIGIVRMKATMSCCRNKNRPASPQLNGWGETIYDSFSLALSPTAHEAGEATDEDEGEEGDEEGVGRESLVARRDREDMFNANVAETLEIQCATGLTIGHVSDATQKLRKAHIHCPHASLGDHAGDGTVKPEVVFGAILTLKKDDPYLHQKDKEEIHRRLYKLKKEDKDGKITRAVLLFGQSTNFSAFA